MKALNLSVITNTTWNVTLPDGTVIDIKKPTQRTLIELSALQDKLTDMGKNPENVTAEQAAKYSDEFVLKIINANTQGKKFNADFVEKNFTNETAMLLIQGFVDFAQELTQNPS